MTQVFRQIAVTAWSWLTAAWATCHRCINGLGSSTPAEEPSESKIEAAIQQANKIIAHSQMQWREKLTAAKAAAATGQGPQPWDRDWIEYQYDIHDEIYEITNHLGWQRTQEFIEILDWALNSPQGRMAMEQQGDPASPWQGPLDLLRELREPLVDASHDMLRCRAEGLEYSPEWDHDLHQALGQLQAAASAQVGGPD